MRAIQIVVVALLVAMGTLMMFFSYTQTDLAMKLAYIGVGVGITSVAITFLSIWIAQESDRKMKAIANLEFDEKAAMLEEYETFFKQNFDMTKLERFMWDMEAITHVAKWADQAKRAKVAVSIDTIATAVTSKIHQDSLHRLRQLSLNIRLCKQGC